MVDCLVDYQTNTTMLVVQFAATVAWLWQISQPYPWELLWKGLGEGGIQWFRLV